MDKSNIIAKIYGYLVCLVAVVTFLITSDTLVKAVIDRGDPLHSGTYSNYGPGNLTSYEVYKMEAVKAAKNNTNPNKDASLTDDKTLRPLFEAQRKEAIQSAMHRINKTLISDILLVVVCILLFITHWRWVRKFTSKP